jgi:hypothetical protein
MKERSMVRTIPDDDHAHEPAELREIREAALDETLAESFPASDPLSTDPNPLSRDVPDGDTQKKA